MRPLCVLLVLIGAFGAWGGPVDPEYVEDWIVFLVFVGMAVGGLLGIIS